MSLYNLYSAKLCAFGWLRVQPLILGDLGVQLGPLQLFHLSLLFSPVVCIKRLLSVRFGNQLRLKVRSKATLHRISPFLAHMSMGIVYAVCYRIFNSLFRLGLWTYYRQMILVSQLLAFFYHLVARASNVTHNLSILCLVTELLSSKFCRTYACPLWHLAKGAHRVPT